MNSTTCQREMQLNSRYHRDSRVVAARKAYRAAIKAGTPERIAWDAANTVYAAVRRELKEGELCR